MIFCFGLKTLPEPLRYQSYLMISLPKVHGYRQTPILIQGRQRTLMKLGVCRMELLSSKSERLPSLGVQGLVFLFSFKQVELLQ